MSDLARRMKPYKERSRLHKDNAIEALEAGNAKLAAVEFEKSRKVIIDDALPYLKDLGEPSPEGGEQATEDEIEIAEQLADCWGILGGVYRAQGDLGEAKKKYDEGYVYESSKRFNILNSYNRVNRLVIRILQNPELLSDPPPLVTDVAGHEMMTMRELLDETSEEIERQLRAGRSDKAWALADCAMIRLLGGLDGVDRALKDLDKISWNDPFPYHSTLKVIRELVQRNLPMTEKLKAVGMRFRQKLPESMKGEPFESGPIAN